MASTQAGRKKRPPPIEIPPPFPQRMIPGPNAFAIASRAQQDAVNVQRQDGSMQTRPYIRPGPNTPVPSPLDGYNAPHLPRSNSTTSRYRESAMTTFSNLMDQARGSSPRKSPRKSNNSYTSTASGQGSTTRSRHSERSYRSNRSNRSALSGQDPLEDLDECNKTLRGEIETQSEKKLFKMMGQIPETPRGGAQLPDHHVTRKDLRPARRGSESSKYSERDERAKSPKKKIFGMSMPTFKTSSNNAPTPPMPAKVAKVLGTSPPGKARKPSPHSSNHTARFAMPRSDTSKSLPSKTYNQRDHHRRHRRHSPNHSTSSQHTASRRSPTKMVQFPNIKQGNHAHGSSSESLGPAPPPPPQKDTPPDRKGKYEVSQMSWLMRGPPPEERSKDPEDFIDKGMKLHIPIAPKVNPIPSNGGQSPSKYCPTGVEDHARLIEAERITSAYGELESIEDESEDRHSAPLENQNSGALETPRPPRWSDGHHLPPRTPLSAKLSGRKPQLQCLPASVYTPDSNSRVAGVGQPANLDERLYFAVPPTSKRERTPEKSQSGSIGVIFRGEASDIEPTSYTAKMLQHAVQTASPSQRQAVSAAHLTTPVKPERKANEADPHRLAGYNPGRLEPEQSSSQLTDMLNGVSPSRTTYNEFQPNCPSAVPSPLQKPPGQSHPMLAGRNAPPPLIDMPMNDHFYITNEHIDVVGCTLYDFIAHCSKQQTTTTSSKHDQLLTAMEHRFEDIKSQISSIGGKADHAANQGHNINVQLGKLFDLIKKDLIEPLSVQNKKVSEMEQSIREVQKSLQELQNSTHHKYPSPAVFPVQHSAHTAFPLPTHQSQPSLTGYYDSTDGGRDSMPRMPNGMSETRRHGNNNYWPRPQPQHGREGREGSHPFSGTNPYNATQYNNSFVGGFTPYGFSQNSDQHYGFDSGTPK